MYKNMIKRLIIPLAGAVIVTILCGTGLFNNPDLFVCDELYQTPEALPGDIKVIGIDEDDFMEFGPYNTWDRTVIASALEALAKDPNNLPAVVAVDALYAGETDPEADERLAAACAKLGNVVMATEASVGRKTVYQDNKFIFNDYAVLNYEEPYEALKKVTDQGHINTMYDTDGILRHAVLYLDSDKGRVYSLPFVAAKKYAEQKGLTIEEPPVDSRGRFYLSYQAAPGDYYEGISLSKLIKGEVPSTYYSGKIVFIGPYAAGLQDAFFTPIARAKEMYGVEFHANAAQAILDGNYKKNAPAAAQLAVLFVLSFAFFIFCDRRRLRFSLPVLIVLVALSILASVWLYSAGIIIHALWIPLSLVLLFIASVAVNYIRAVIARQQVTKTFERYVAPNIVGEILKEGTDNLKLGGKLCNIAVLFVDIRGFTTMSERLSPEEVVHILNQYLSMTSSCIENNNGTLDKFIGDATMAFWGAPIEDDDPVYHATRAALDIVEGAKVLSAKLKEEVGEELNVGVGVHYGPAVVGNMGSERRMDYTAIGDTVNTSARLEANAPKGTVFISRAVADELGDRVKYESLGDSIRLKGKAEGFEVLKLTGLEG
ncbi:MAG: CHASE2 domain-containing protein [Clostridiales bacterium]|nr:CHASE2 domain-containing protein [Clostridiales bacterium]